MSLFNNVFDYKVIYIFTINDVNHIGKVKIGDTTFSSIKSISELSPNCEELVKCANDRIKQICGTSGIDYNIEHVELGIDNKNKLFRDYKVHNVLLRSGIEKAKLGNSKEWFVCDKETAVKAINAVKEGKKSIDGMTYTESMSPIIFRPEQEEAIKLTKKRFRSKNHFLWNAKMRFGKTLCALEVVKQCGFKKTLIITHRPVVKEGWYKDFKKIFVDTNYKYASRTHGEDIKDLINSSNPYVYFASIQDLRGSETVGGKFDKNNELFKCPWDFLIIDEAHEGTTTELGQKVKEAIKNDNIKVLELSGTPFNIMEDYESDEIFTWDYIMEQEAKLTWEEEHDGDSNPYADLPKLNIYTYDLGELLNDARFEDVMDKSFNFAEFFRVKKDTFDNDTDEFLYEDKVIDFLNLLSGNNNSNYPFTTEEYRNMFRHTLWRVPGVASAKALSKLLRNHAVFGNGGFEIVNVAGDGDVEYDNALDLVNKAIKKAEENNTYTITLSCGKLTTGVTVPEWTACLMLSGSANTNAANYLQTIFRVTSTYNKNGKFKNNAYVFDFAPDRTLQMLVKSVKISSKKKIELEGKDEQEDRDKLGALLNFLPVISIKGSIMQEYSVDYMYGELKKIYIEKVVDTGFDNEDLYNINMLKLDKVDIKEFNELEAKIGKTQQTKKTTKIDVNYHGLTKEERERIRKLNKQRRQERYNNLSEEDKKLLEKLAEEKKQKKNCIAILRGISIRMPLLVYGLDKEITKVSELKNEVDNVSWEEFMPSGVTKDIFKKFEKYYDEDIFKGAVKRIRKIAKSADALEPEERVKVIGDLFLKFRNPDKETVLTPWRVVNMHLSDTIGGYDFFDKEHKNLVSGKPRYVNQGQVTKNAFDINSKVLEINSKTGLYPLYMAYSIFVNKQSKYKISKPEMDYNSIWEETLKDNIFVICKTPMAVSITNITLAGYKKYNVHAKYYKNIIDTMKNTPDTFTKKILSPKFWEIGGNELKFNVIVGNPPYQFSNHQQIYPYFYINSIKIAKIVSLIFPVGWQEPKNGNNLSVLNKQEIKEDKQIVSIDNRQNVFVGVPGAEWVNIILWIKNSNNNLNGKQKILEEGKFLENRHLDFIISEDSKPKEILELKNIVEKSNSFKSIDSFISSRKPYNIDTKFSGIDEFINKEEDCITIYGTDNKTAIIRYLPKDFIIPKQENNVNKYKVFVPYAWGNMSEKEFLGGAFADVILAKPNEICSETYLETYPCDDLEIVKKHAKYLMTKFLRALLYVNKHSHHSTTAWGAIPLQTYEEQWWNKSVEEIDEELMNKYNLPEEIKEFIRKNFEEKFEINIKNFN